MIRGKDGETSAAERAKPAIPSAREGRSPFGIWQPAWTPIYQDAAGIRAEMKIPSSALPQAGPVRSSERQEPHRPWTHGPNRYDSTGGEVALDEVERIRI